MKKHIPQYEFGFTGATFNLAGQETADGARIAAEREQAARDRAASEARQAVIPSPLSSGCGECGAGAGLCDCGSWDYETETTTPGLRAGSAWHKWKDTGMAKALATMQGAR